MSWVGAGVSAAGAIGGALMGGGDAPKTPKYIKDASKEVVSLGRGIASRPYEGYSGVRVAGLSGNEQAAAGLAGSMSGKYQPMLNRAGAAFDPSQLTQFENPYMDKVVKGRLDDVGRAYDSQLGNLNRKRGMMDAFGTDRGSMMETALMRDRARELDRVSNEGRSSAHQSALDSYFKDKSSALDAARIGASVDTNSINSMLETGGRQRTVDQLGKDFDYGQFLEKRDWNVSNMEPLLNAIRAASGANPQTSPDQTNYGSLLAGLGSTVGGALMAGGAGKPGGGLYDTPGLSPIEITAQRM